MGSFSWLKADELTKVANVEWGKRFKFLIPKEFGGGFILDTYQDLGLLGQKEDGEPKYDMFEILAFWNEGSLKYGKLRYEGKFPLMKEIDEHTCDNRGLGGSIGTWKKDIDKLKFPLKLVSHSYRGTYEDLKKPSYNDPYGGYGTLTRKRLKNEFPEIQ